MKPPLAQSGFLHRGHNGPTNLLLLGDSSSLPPQLDRCDLGKMPHLRASSIQELIARHMERVTHLLQHHKLILGSGLEDHLFFIPEEREHTAPQAWGCGLASKP